MTEQHFENLEQKMRSYDFENMEGGEPEKNFASVLKAQNTLVHPKSNQNIWVREELIKKLEQFFRLENLPAAHNLLKIFVHLYPEDFRGWWGYLRLYSREIADKFTNREFLYHSKEIFKKYPIEIMYQKSIKYMPETEKKIKANAYTVWMKSLSLYTLYKEMNTDINDLETQKRELKNQIDNRRKDILKHSQKIKKQKFVLIGIFAVVLFTFHKASVFVIDFVQTKKGNSTLVLGILAILMSIGTFWGVYKHYITQKDRLVHLELDIQEKNYNLENLKQKLKDMEKKKTHFMNQKKLLILD